MSHKAVTCEHCGALCNQDDGYCKSCWKKLPTDETGDDYVLEGKGHSEWIDFIEKRTDHYMPVFKKNEGKSVFVSWNWAAFFFANNWMFYRKMYKYALILAAIFVVVTSILTVGLTLPHAADIREWGILIEEYESYVDGGGALKIYTDDENYYFPDVVTQGHQAENNLAMLEVTILLQATLVSALVQSVFFGLFGDALYKRYAQKRIGQKPGGASLISWFGGVLLFDVIESFVYPLVIGFAAVMIMLISAVL